MYARASKLVIASMRRRFAPTLDSLVIFTNPISLVADTWCRRRALERLLDIEHAHELAVLLAERAMTPASRAEVIDVS